MRSTTIGILAHADAGKTTLSESILYASGSIRRRGRVDHGDTFLDTDELEKKRGITIYSSPARFELQGRPFTILDTPGHADFSPEMERTLRVLDAAVLVVSAADIIAQKGADPQVRVLWRLLAHYRVPTLLFINKMDQQQTDNRRLLSGLLEKDLGTGMVLFDERQLCQDNAEAVAVCDETLLEQVLDGRQVTDRDAARLVAERLLFPVYFGSALRDEGTSALMDGLMRYTSPPDPAPRGEGRDAEEPFGAIVYKITREDGVRLTWMKITSGTLSVRDGAVDDDEKVSELRLYSGSRYTAVTTARAGDIVAAAGLSRTRAGDGLGVMVSRHEELLTPIMTSRVTATDLYGRRTDDFTLMKALRLLEEQEPVLRPSQEEETGDITVHIMGQVQTEVLQEQLRERCGLRAQFGPGTIVYRETIRRPVEGVGHFEPLRHYAEVHLVLEPLESGSGLVYEDDCAPDTLERNWRNLIMTHLSEKVHRGVLTGAAVTDMQIRLIGGRASRRHTSGGDFRRATYAAVRQGLMMAENILLEPVMAFRLEVPSACLGRAMTDISRMCGHARPVEIQENSAVLEGTVPASELGDYARTVTGYTGGRGRLSVSLSGYEPCHNARQIMDEKGYDPDADRNNPTWSVFCSHGAGTVVPWDRVRDFMHVDTGWTPPLPEGPFRSDDYYTFAPVHTELFEIDRGEDALPGTASPGTDARGLRAGEDGTAGTGGSGDHSARRHKTRSFKEREAAFCAGEEELERIFERTYGPVKRRLRHPENERLREEDRERPSGREGSPEGDPKYHRRSRPQEQQDFLLVDGYNIIFAWEDLKDLASADIGAARDRLQEILSDYAGWSGRTVILVFDAYRVPGGRGEVLRWHNIDVVYTKEAETADLYIEKTAHRLTKNHRVTVATGDRVEQVIIFGAGALRLSPRGLLEDILYAQQDLRERYLKT